MSLVFVGVPCYQGVSPEVLEDWMRFMYHCGRRMPQHDFALGIKTKSEQFRARNAIVTAARRVSADWVLMIDDDMIINPDITQGPTDAYGFIETLIGHDKDICGALYYQRSGACRPVLMTRTDDGYRFLRDDEVTHELQAVDVAGGGCLLIRGSVLDALPDPIFAPEHEFGTDLQLCKQAQANGYEVWADTSIELGHVRQERVVVTSANRHQFQVSDTLPGEATQMVARDLYAPLVADAQDYTGWTEAEMHQRAGWFMREWESHTGTLAEWYAQFPKDRVARQVWFNTTFKHKQEMTTFLLSAISDDRPLQVLDFGCGIGIPAFALAQRGHRVTACDLDRTGTFDFLQWRAEKHHVDMVFHKSPGGVPPLGGQQFNVIIAMDCLEHIPEWRRVLETLVDHLAPGGILFANNAILDDPTHPEHIDLQPKDFQQACLDVGLMTLNQVTYTKQPQPAAVAV